MPSPLAHIGIALAAEHLLRRPGERWDPRVLVTVAVTAVAADLDLLPDLWLGEGIHFHHGPTHSLVGALLLGALAVWSLGGRRRFGAAAACVIAALLHAPMDYTTGEPGAPEKYGVQYLWPWSERRYIDARPIFGAYHIDREGGLVHMFTGDAAANYGVELAAVAAAWGVAGLGAAGARRYAQRGALTSTNS